jgi:hypothetical protein
MSIENHGEIVSVGEKSTRALWHYYQQIHLVTKQEELKKEMINLKLKLSL